MRPAKPSTASGPGSIRQAGFPRRSPWGGTAIPRPDVSEGRTALERVAAEGLAGTRPRRDGRSRRCTLVQAVDHRRAPDATARNRVQRLPTERRGCRAHGRGAGWTGARGGPRRERAHREGADPMGTALPAFTPLEDSLYVTLCSRALDHRSAHPVLGDALADEIVRELDYDIDQLRIDANLINTCALRAKRLDEVAADFVARHPDAVGLDLGAGLDTSSARIAAPPTVDWYDADLPAVVAAREQVVPRHADPDRKSVE